jgi:hypothetical protein
MQKQAGDMPSHLRFGGIGMPGPHPRFREAARLPPEARGLGQTLLRCHAPVNDALPLLRFRHAPGILRRIPANSSPVSRLPPHTSFRFLGSHSSSARPFKSLQIRQQYYPVSDIRFFATKRHPFDEAQGRQERGSDSDIVASRRRATFPPFPFCPFPLFSHPCS